jgi:hypothetical protein
MHFDWIVNPIVQYGALTAVLIACLTLFVSLKFDVAVARRDAEKTCTAMSQQLRDMEAAMGRLREKLAEPREQPSIQISVGLNINRRVQALRMRNRGESVETIAAALRTHRNEIELLLKLHRMVQAPAPSRATIETPRALAAARTS